MRFLFILVSLSFFSNSFAQPIIRCGTTDKINEQALKDPAAVLRSENANLIAKEWIRDHPNKINGGVISIPTVIHVIYRLPIQQISNAQVLSQMNILTDDYRRTNPNAIATRPEFDSIVGDTEIEFCLATFDPLGNPTTGINYYPTTISNIGGGNQYFIVAPIWNRDEYMNIWVCEIGGGVLGFGYPPGLAGPTNDGVVIDYRYFGNTGTATPPYNMGRTTTHEVGHWLGLNHIFSNGTCVDDGVLDTPIQKNSTFSCDFILNSCVDVPFDYHDMVENYMGYTDDVCMNAFTIGQGQAMIAVLATSRAGIPTSEGCGPIEIQSSLERENFFRIFPSVSEGIFTIEFSLGTEVEKSIRIIDAKGLIVSTVHTNENSIQLNLSGKDQGLYFVQATANGNQSSEKIIVLK